MAAAVDAMNKFLANTSNAAVLKEMIDPEATYISLNFDHPDLKEVMPWAGTHEKAGPDAIIKTFADVAWFWEVLEFDPTDVFGDQTRAAVFGKFTYRSRKLQQKVSSPFAVFLRLNEKGLISYMQFMEDTLMTTASFRKSGKWLIESNPEGGSFEIPLKEGYLSKGD